MPPLSSDHRDEVRNRPFFGSWFIRGKPKFFLRVPGRTTPKLVPEPWDFLSFRTRVLSMRDGVSRTNKAHNRENKRSRLSGGSEYSPMNIQLLVLLTHEPQSNLRRRRRCDGRWSEAAVVGASCAAPDESGRRQCSR